MIFEREDFDVFKEKLSEIDSAGRQVTGLNLKAIVDLRFKKRLNNGADEIRLKMCRYPSTDSSSKPMYALLIDDDSYVVINEEDAKSLYESYFSEEDIENSLSDEQPGI